MSQIEESGRRTAVRPRSPRSPAHAQKLAEGFPTHVGRDGRGSWHALAAEEVADRRARGWTVTRIVSAANADHPVRLRVLDLLEQVDESHAAAMAKDLDVALGTVAYHVRALAEAGEIVLTRTEPRRSAVAHFYKLNRTPAGQERLWCEKGHWWHRATVRGRKPTYCHEHRRGSTPPSLDDTAVG